MVTKIIKCLLRKKLNVIVEIYRQKVVDFLDLTVLNDIIYVNMALGTSFALYSDNTFFTLQPMYLFELGFSRVRWSSFLHFETYVWIANFINDFYHWIIFVSRNLNSQADAAVIIAIGIIFFNSEIRVIYISRGLIWIKFQTTSGAAADFVSRIFLTLMSLCIHVKARYVYLAGAIFMILSRFGLIKNNFKILFLQLINRLIIFWINNSFLEPIRFLRNGCHNGLYGLF